MIKNWKTTSYGVLIVASFIVGYFFPQYKDFCTQLIEILVGVGFIVAVKDHDVTGGSR